MPRRCTTSVLMMAYLASQLAAAPHAHGATGETQPSDHNARPHVHVGWFDHGDHAHDDGHRHHHPCDENDSQPPGSKSHGGDRDHDSDAVYLPNEAVAPSTKSAVSPASLAVSTLGIIASIAAPTASGYSASTIFPDKCSSGCPLYLALRALRI